VGCPSLVELRVAAGIFAVGVLVVTLMLKVGGFLPSGGNFSLLRTEYPVLASKPAHMPPDPRADALSDDDLVARVAAGDAEAFASLFRRRHAAVYRFALHMTGSAPVAEDVTQEAFLAVMRDAARYQPGRSGVAAWLCGIARNHALRRLGADRRIVLARDDMTAEAEPVSEQPSPLENLTRAEGIESLRAAVLGLPVPFREAVVLCDLQELSYAAAAEALGCAIGTVRSRLHRGRALLAAALAERQAGDVEDARPREPASRPVPPLKIRGLA
jgi:RNA polymerase sigma-70 factor (ECF subfamily)